MSPVTRRRVLLIGASGLIGSAILGRLSSAGIEVIAVARDIGKPEARRLGATWARLDLARADAGDWLKVLDGVDAVINCAGLLAGGGQAVERVHERGPAVLFAACEQAGVRRVIHVSAIGVDRQTPTRFSASKRAGEAALEASGLDWVILRPSVVVGAAAYGGSALFRGLAALPIFPDLPGAGQLQVVQLDDVAETVVRLLTPNAPSRIGLDLAGPERLTFAEVVGRYRAWLGWPPARRWRLPRWIAALAYRLGDLAAGLGWRPPVRTVAGREILRGAVGDAAAWRDATGLTPQSLEAALMARPATVQERWFAQLYFLKPVVFTILSLFWIGTGVVSLTNGWRIGVGMMEEGGGSVERAQRRRRRSGRYLHRRRHRLSALHPSGALGGDRDLPVLRRRRDVAAAQALERPPGADVEDMADPGAALHGAGYPGRPLMVYFALKFLHIIGAAVLLGTGAGIAFFMLMAHRTGEAKVIAATARIVVIADFLFTATAVVVQPITGLLLAREVGYALSEGWIVLSILLYLVTGAFWLPVVWMQARMRDLARAAAEAGEPPPAAYHRLFGWWFAFGFPAFAAVVAIFWLMISRPSFSLW